MLGAGPAQLGLLRAARARGLYVVACDRDPLAVGFEYADRRAVVSTEDEQDVARLAEAERVDGIISPGADWPVAVAARVAERLGLPHPVSPETAALATQKLRQRARLAERGVSQPRWTADPAEAVSCGLPCVVKAPDRQGQRGLTLVRDAGELAEALETARAASRAGGVVVEELAPGPEVTVNGFSVAGRFFPLTVTDRIVAEPPAFGVALAHAWPGEAAGPAAVAAAEAAATALELENGPSYTQIRVGPDGPQVVELAARLGGGHDAELCETALGLDLNGLAIAAALGEDFGPWLGGLEQASEAGLAALGKPAASLPEAAADGGPPRAGGACVRFLVAPEGELVAVEGLEDALAVPGVVETRAYRRPGWRFGPLRRGADRAGFVLARGDSRAEALARAGRAAECVRFVVDVEARVQTEA